MIGVLLISQAVGSWPVYGGDEAHSGAQIMRGAMSSSPVFLWKYSVGADVEHQFSAVADVDGDGSPEVIMATMDPAFSLRCIDGTTGSLEWSADIGSESYSSPAVGDVDGDGNVEIVVGNWNNGVYCLSGVSGAIEWSADFGNVVYPSPALADVDGDGKVEVIVGSHTGRIYCLSGGTGATEWSFNTGNSQIWCSPAVADVDGDGEMEVLAGADDGDVYCLNGATGSEEWNNPGWNTVWGISVADVNGDGSLEVVSCGNNGWVRCLEGSTGGMLWSFYASDVRAPAAVGDLDGDGSMEVIFGNYNGVVYCLSGSDGSSKWNYSTSHAVHDPISLADVNEDGYMEVLVPNWNTAGATDTLYCLQNNGNLLWKIGLSNDVHAIVPADIDGDGCVELVTGTATDTIYALDDATNVSDCGILYSGSHERSAGSLTEFRALGQGIYLFLPRRTWVSLSLFDVSGRLAETLYHGVLDAGHHEFVPKTIKKGLYMALLVCEGQTEYLNIIKP